MNATLTRMIALAEAGPINEVEAWARPRAEQGDADAQYILGWLPSTAPGRMDHRECRDWLRRAEAQGHAEAIYELSRIDETVDQWHSMTPKNDRMRARLRRAAELGSVRAQNALATSLSTGHGGFQVDKNESRLWRERAAATGDRDARAALATMVLRGEGGPSDIAQAIALFEGVAATDLAADGMAPLHVSSAAQWLWRLYTVGAPYGIAPDADKAERAQRRRAEARAVLDASRAADEYAIGQDASGNRVVRPNAFANEAEAKAVLAEFMTTQRKRSYADLVQLIWKRQRTKTVGPSGISYDVDIDVHWEDQPNGPLWVTGSIKDEGWRTYRSLHEIYILHPGGHITE
jgi:hypothetical protein